MQKNALRGVIASLLLLGATGINQAVPRLQPARLRIVPVERLAQQVGEWKSVGDLALDEKTKQILPKSHFLTRVYKSPSGETISLLLQTSPEPGEYHTPTVCLPTQGWSIVRTQPTRVGLNGAPGELSATEMWMEQGNEKQVVLYWYTTEQQLDKWEALLGKVTGSPIGTRLFVRLMASATPGYEETSRVLHTFGMEITPVLAALEK